MKLIIDKFKKVMTINKVILNEKKGAEIIEIEKYIFNKC